MAAPNRTSFSQDAPELPHRRSNISKQIAAPAVTKTEIAFVNLTDSSGPVQDAEKRKLVRTHVMRGYQRQKQAQEEEEVQRLYHGRLVEPKLPIVSIIPQVEPEVESSTDAAPNLEPSFPEEVDWSAFLEYRPYHTEPDRMFEQQIDGGWVPVTEYNSQHDLFAPMDTIYNADVMNYRAGQPSDSALHLNSLSSETPSQYLHQPELIPGEVECPLISQSLTLSLSFNALNSGKLDPFNAMPGLKNARAQALMYHYNKVLVNTLIPVNPKDKWFNYAISDEALFHATMLHSAGHNAMLSGNYDLADPFQLKLEAVRLVNRRLNDPVQSISDLTIAAVACLVLFENQSGNLELSNIHMEGLRRMVNLRGGLQNLGGLSGVLQRKILWAEVCNAMLSQSQPRLNLPQTSQALVVTSVPSTSLTNLPNPPPAWLNNPEHNQVQSCSCDKHLTSIINDLRTISNQPPINAIDGPITDHLYLVERHLVTLLSPSAQNANRHSPACKTVNYPCFLAALSYIYISLRDFPLQAPLFTAFVTRLDGALFGGESDLWSRWSENSYPMLLWVLAVGALAANGRAEKGRFVRELEKASWVLGIEEFDHFVGTLLNIVWNVRSENGEAVLMRLWDEVLEIRRARLLNATMEIPAIQGSYGNLIGDYGGLYIMVTYDLPLFPKRDTFSFCLIYKAPLSL